MTTQFVHAVPLSVKQFTEKDLLLSQKYISDEVYPGLYNRESKEFQYIDRRIMNISDIETSLPESLFAGMDTKYRNNLYNQLVFIRSTGRGQEADRVDSSLTEAGYELNHVPISIALTPGGIDVIVDGRTRLNRLIEAGFTNVIVDYYICTEWSAFLKEAIKRNRPDSPRSPMTKTDIINNCNGAVKMGWLSREEGAIRDYVEDITGGRIQKNVMDKVIQSVKWGKGHTADVKSVDEREAKEFLKMNGYVNNENNNGIYYHTVSASAWTKAVVYSAKELYEYEASGANVKELRIVLHTGTLDAADPGLSWQNKIDNFRSGWKEDLNDIERSYFKDSKRRPIIRLFGAIPAVSDLGYPMDKLVMFHVGKLATMSFRDIRENNRLSNNFDISEE